MGIAHSISTKLVQRRGNPTYRCAIVSMQGYRPTMEDSHSICFSLPNHPETGFFGVFDGHCKPNFAQFASKEVPFQINQLNDPFSHHSLLTTVRKIDTPDVPGKKNEIKNFILIGGCTVVFCLTQPIANTDNVKVTVGHVGDSRAIVVHVDGSYECLTKDHHPSNFEDDTRRIYAAEGFVRADRVNGNLAMGRALGDFSYKYNPYLPDNLQTVTPIIQTSSLIINKKDLLFISCDGIFEETTTERSMYTLHSIINEHAKGHVYENIDLGHILCEFFEKSNDSKDNMTAMLIQFSDGTSYNEDKDLLVPGLLTAKSMKNESFMEYYIENLRRYGLDDETTSTLINLLKEEKEGTRPSPQHSSSPLFISLPDLLPSLSTELPPSTFSQTEYANTNGDTLLHTYAYINDIPNLTSNLNSIDVNSQNIFGDTPLIVAIRQNNIEAINCLLSHPDIDIHRCNKFGWNAIMESTNMNVSQILLENGASFTKPLPRNFNPLHLAILRCDLSYLQFLLQNNCPIIGDFRGIYPHHLLGFHLCLHDRFSNDTLPFDEEKYKDPETIKTCFIVNHTSWDFIHISLARSLLDKLTPAQLNAVSSEKRSALHYACITRHLHYAILLVEAGIDMTIPDINGKTALHYLLNTSHGVVIPETPEQVRHLILNKDVEFFIRAQCMRKLCVGEVVNIMDAEGNTPLHTTDPLYTVNDTTGEISSIFKFCLDFGANLNIRNNKGQTPLFTQKNFEPINELINIGAKHDIFDNQNNNIYHNYVDNPTIFVQLLNLKVLLPYLSSINTQGQTPLHLLLSKWSSYYFQRIAIDDIWPNVLKNFDNINAADNQGNTLLHLCLMNGYHHDSLLKGINNNQTDFTRRVFDMVFSSDSKDTKCDMPTLPPKEEPQQEIKKIFPPHFFHPLELILKHNAKSNIPNHQGKTAFDLIVPNDNQLFELFQNYGSQAISK